MNKFIPCLMLIASFLAPHMNAVAQWDVKLPVPVADPVPNSNWHAEVMQDLQELRQSTSLLMEKMEELKKAATKGEGFQSSSPGSSFTEEIKLMLIENNLSLMKDIKLLIDERFEKEKAVQVKQNDFTAEPVVPPRFTPPEMTFTRKVVMHTFPPGYKACPACDKWKAEVMPQLLAQGIAVEIAADTTTGSVPWFEVCPNGEVCRRVVGYTPLQSILRMMR